MSKENGQIRITKAPLQPFKPERDTTLHRIADRLQARYIPLEEQVPAEKESSSFSFLLSVLWLLFRNLPTIIGAVMLQDKSKLIGILVSLAVALISHFFGVGADWVIPFSDLFTDGGLTLQSALEGLGGLGVALFITSPADKKKLKQQGQ